MERHLVLTLGRSGSNTLVDMLNQNPEVLNVGELLGEWNRIRKLQRALRLPLDNKDYLDTVLFGRHSCSLLNLVRNGSKVLSGRSQEVKSSRDIKAYGFKEFSLNFERYRLREYVRENDRLKVVGLVRGNVLDRLISTRMMSETGVVARREGAAGLGRRIRLDPSALVCSLECIEQENRVLCTMLNELPGQRVYLIDYEELFSDPSRTEAIMREVFDFLGVRQIRPEIRMRKILPRSPGDAIENLQECLQAVRGTRFELVFARQG